jgi:hypothetical protein
LFEIKSLTEIRWRGKKHNNFNGRILYHHDLFKDKTTHQNEGLDADKYDRLACGYFE